MAALLLTLLFFCMPSQLYLFPGAQKCSEILPAVLLLPASWSQPFTSFFSCAYLMSFYGQPRRWVQDGFPRMQAYLVVPEIFRSSWRSSKLSIPRSWFCWLDRPRGNQLMLLFISWSCLLLLLGMPSLVKGAGDSLKFDGHAGYVEDWQRGGKGTDLFSESSEFQRVRHNRHGEPPPGRAVESEWRGPFFTSRFDSLTSDEVNICQGPSLERNSWDKVSGAESGGQEAVLVGSRDLESSHFGSLLRDCLKVKCCPSGNYDGKQSSLEETLTLSSRGGSPTFQGPISAAPHVAIIPPFLEWGSQPVFSPSVASLTVVNTCNSTQLRVFQPFSTGMQFYTSGFEEKVVDPGGELSIPIIFLPRALGVAEAILIVQTSAGGFLVQAQGRGILSPYKVQSLQGLRVAAGETLHHTIVLYNPHDEVLRVGEVYACPSKFGEISVSGSDGSVEREVTPGNDFFDRADLRYGGVVKLVSEHSDPRGIDGGAAVIQMRPPGQLEIGPHSSNPIAEFEFAALKSDKYSGSLYIKLFRGMQESADVLILPIDVQVGQAKGHPSPVEPVLDVLEFGILTKEDQTSKVDVVLYNPGLEAVQVEDISLLMEDENIVHIEYRKGLVLAPNRETKVAAVTYMGREETVPSGLFECHPRELLRDRKLIVKTNSSFSPKLEVPYRALVFHGSVECDPAQGSVGFVPKKTDGNNGEGLSASKGGALSERRQRVYFETSLSVPLPFFIDLERTARLRSLCSERLCPSVPMTDSICCHELSPGHFALPVRPQSILLQTELVYPVVQIGTEDRHWVNVTNPSDEPLYVALLVSSKAEAGDQSCQHFGMQPEDPVSDQSIGATSSSPDSRVLCHLPDSEGDVFYLADGAIADILLEPHGTAALGPVVFRPSEKCLWTGLLSLWNNLTQVEWAALQGSGGSGSLTFLDGDYPIDVLQIKVDDSISDAVEEKVVGKDKTKDKAVCSQPVSSGFWVKNTGDILLDVKALELVGGGCSAYGFDLDPCQGFTLAPGQRAELLISFQPVFSAGVFQRDLQLTTSAGVVQIPLLANLPTQCSKIAQSTYLGILYLIVAQLTIFEIVCHIVCCALLPPVMWKFGKMLYYEMEVSKKQESNNGPKSAPPQKVGGRQAAPVLSSQAHGNVVTKVNNSAILPGRLKCSSGEPEVQSRTGDGTGASGPGRPRESMKGLVRALKGVADSFTGTMGSTSGSEESKPDTASPSGLPAGLRVKIPNCTAFSIQKSNLGSPMRDTPSPSSSHSRKGMADRRSHIGRFDGLQAKIAPEPLEESSPLPVKQSPMPKSPKPVICCTNSSASKQGADREGSKQSDQQTAAPSITSTASTGSAIPSPRKGSQFKQVLSPKPQPPSPKSQPQTPNAGAVEKEKGKRRKRRSNMGTLKQEPVSKGRSGSSSPSSSPASPATPASPSRPVSPLHHSDLHPNVIPRSPPRCCISKIAEGTQTTSITSLSKLDAAVELPSSNCEPGNGSLQELPVYRRSESLSVDVASTALREMAQAKSADWSTISAKVNRSSDKKCDGVTGKRGGVAKDWATVARRATVGTGVAGKEAMTDDRSWGRRAWPSSGPALTPSATFPRRQDLSSEWKFVDEEQDIIKPVGTAPVLVPASTMPPAARAPGAKIGKEIGWNGRSEYTQESSNIWGDILDQKSDVSNCLPGLSSEDQRLYDIWGNHFGEISRCSTQDMASVGAGVTVGALQSLSATPSFFSSFPQPSFPSSDSPLLSPTLSGVSSGFSVFSQAPDIETFCLPSTLFNSPKTVPSPSSLFSDVSACNNLGAGRNGFKNHGFGGSLPGSPRKVRAPYSPPLGPSPMSNEFVPLVISETGGDPSYSFWSGSGTYTKPIHLRS